MGHRSVKVTESNLEHFQSRQARLHHSKYSPVGELSRIEHRVRMLFGVFGAYRVLPLECKPAYRVGDLAP